MIRRGLANKARCDFFFNLSRLNYTRAIEPCHVCWLCSQCRNLYSRLFWWATALLNELPNRLYRVWFGRFFIFLTRKAGFIAPTEVRCEFLKSSFFVVAVFIWPNRVIIRMNMHREATRNTHMAPWGWGD